MSTYTPASVADYDLLKKVMQDYPEHEPLVSTEVSIALIYAHGKEKKDGTVTDALKLHGVKALAIASIRNIKDRAEDMSDCKVTVDGDFWENASEPEKVALLDHELYHFELVLNENLEPESDDLGRPKLKMRPHSAQFGWFYHIAERHGLASQECKQARQIAESTGSTLFPSLPQPAGVAVLPEWTQEAREDAATFQRNVLQLAAAGAGK